MRMGIDFGTTRTVVSAVEAGNYPVCTFNVQGELKEYIPSLVAVRDGQLHFGWGATALASDPGSTLLRSMKRLIGFAGPEESVQLAPGLTIELIELVTLFLAHLRTMIVRHSNLEIQRREALEVMIAAPANANSNQRFITLEAFKRAGFEVQGMVSEPSAAAIEFAQRNLKSVGPRSPKKYLVVYDIGGGTFDTAVVSLQDNHYDVIATDGIEKLGGDDIDGQILDMALEGLRIDPRTLGASQLVRLLEECRERKEGLRPNTRKMVVDVGGVLEQGSETEVVLATDELYARCQPLIDRTVQAVQRVIEHAGTGEDDGDDARGLAAVYLVGGSVAFPAIGRALRDTYQRKVKVSPFPHAATAIGLAIAADPEARVLVHEAVSRHFGVWREHEKGRLKVFDPIFEKNLLVTDRVDGLQVVRRYGPVHNIGHLRFLECSLLNASGDPEGNLTPWQEVLFPYDPALRELDSLECVPVEERLDLAAQEIVETYRYDASGIIHVEIENRTGGYRRGYTLGRGLGRARAMAESRG